MSINQENEKTQSEFIARVSEFINTLHADMPDEKTDGQPNRGFIILASEKLDGSDDTQQVMGFGGDTVEIAKNVSQLATRSEVRDAFKLGLYIAAQIMKKEKPNINIIAL